ncbi:hypothetical protein GE253_02830 [Niveispirillum sp. SYP-B3756]|uniref:hypothetical protein n=1 Tax=Niveispirillum sp. SYP-B3756 TaxID=2662178 RepID=UPI001291E1B1|nr:hypothetical protein [Niveispirillum sp. SYP-B3756]MQP64271.1 hypothetical protein [Niveispirillum sp. SYP-B3756]
MAGITTPALSALSAVNTVKSTVKQVRDLTGATDRKAEKQLAERQQSDLNSLRARQDADTTALRANVQNQADQIATNSASDERKRQRALRRAVGRTRAQLGSQGISTADGSGEAILLGQTREAEEEKADADRLNALRIKALEQQEQSEYQRNLLELSELQERQRLERLARR